MRELCHLGDPYVEGPRSEWTQFAQHDDTVLPLRGWRLFHAHQRLIPGTHTHTYTHTYTSTHGLTVCVCVCEVCVVCVVCVCVVCHLKRKTWNGSLTGKPSLRILIVSKIPE